MNRTRPKQIVIRASEDEFSKIKGKVEKSKLTQNEYLLKCCLNKKVIVVEGLQDLTLELKKIGTHLDKIDKQMIKDNNSCRNELHDVKEEMREAWQLLRQLIQKIR